jgi:hypothetical protein
LKATEIGRITRTSEVSGRTVGAINTASTTVARAIAASAYTRVIKVGPPLAEVDVPSLPSLPL